ncbi:MAG TPA: ATP-binding protein [Burkholderiaceae bacterium]|nr:ATP-binding protein [Burkholderiaceae bacterium]
MRKNRSSRPVPLRLRLALLLGLCAGTTALFGVAAVMTAGIWFEPARVEAEAQELAGTLAYALEVPLAFDDSRAANETLAMLRARSDVRSATVFDAQNRRVARYEIAGGTTSGRSRVNPWAHDLTVEKTIGSGGQPLGRIVLQQSLDPVYRSLLLQLAAILFGTLLGLAVSLAIARRIARRITDPVAALAQASSAIARDKDYSRRLEGGRDDEVGRAVVAFNRMLDELQARDASLETAVATLETRVAERTRDLRREKERAESASRAKTSFLANMSHELRTPLNAVIGAAQLLQQSDGERDQTHLIEIVRNSGVNLLGLIENVLDVSRIEAGELPVLCDDFNLADCLEAALATASVAARAKGLTICGIIDPKLPVWCNGDAMRLRQVVLNLLGNAVKFTLRGDVVLQASVGSRPGAVRIHVRDSGIGIEPGKLGEIFEPFRQADEATTRRFGGTGLGLAISRRLVRAMGGDITVASVPGRGSEFGFEIVLAAPASHIASTPPLDHEILYFEPHETSAAALAALLERCGCRSRRITSAADLAASSSSQTLPWLLVATDSDAAMPLLESAQRWIAAERLVEMSHADSAADSAARRRFPLTRGLVKPVLRGALVSRFGSGSRMREVTGPGELDEAPNAGLILIVEDDPTNQLIVGSMLVNAGYGVRTANDGSHALALLREHAFDLVLMDWQMPDMDGLAVTRLIRAGAIGAYGEHVPIVALTANAFAEDRTACLAAGMNDFLTKPVLASQLLAVVGRWALTPES